MSLTTLRNRYRKADQAYRSGRPIMTDAEFDALATELQAAAPYCAELNPSLAMLSLDVPSSFDDWYSAVGVGLLVAQTKIDGCTLACRYVGGELVAAWTRSGRCAMTVAAAVHGVRAAHPTMECVVVGELWHPSDRNVVATALRLDRTKCADEFNFSAFRVQQPGDRWQFEAHMLDWLDNSGFDIPETRVCCDKQDVIDFHDRSHDVISDGTVVKVASMEAQRRLGNGSIAPRWAIAIKQKYQFTD